MRAAGAENCTAQVCRRESLQKSLRFHFLGRNIHVWKILSAIRFRRMISTSINTAPFLIACDRLMGQTTTAAPSMAPCTFLTQAVANLFFHVTWKFFVCAVVLMLRGITQMEQRPIQQHITSSAICS
jgi:hypothetical protein